MTFLPPSGRRFAAASAILFALSGCANPPAAGAQDRVSRSAETATPASDGDAHIAEAAQRFGIPERWIRAVMEAESAGNARAVSSAGAMGLMQIMPGTWAELRAAHGFGANPFDRRENILAGTAYLRQMYDQFGAPGFLAAYNAGPGRYAEHLRTGRSLPRETRRYVASLSQELGFSDALPLQPIRTVSADRWQAAPLFAPVSTSRETQLGAEPDRTSADVQTAEEPPLPRSQHSQSNPLFVSRTGEPER
ncbi:lytic transglycosylase domain-containing protein [Actibacterium sp. 188UL27-1]|uniref:lytic transglycosylase domain-containing protein n=1 Tax=Actibacterium sp. 188UL27-1 TaxID=2786961 RepID=UPI00195CA1FC|nr:lytic transglycosylase domain-containing protein [Actibacterium sp. 188UL27-1]MBM7067555.1 lytic transglycosylase domain-containing protein [Actibacterium sp. 188UL27-1]